MQKLDLDFVAARRGSPWAGRVLLALAAFIAADVGMSYRDARQALTDNQKVASSRRPPAAKASTQEVAAVRETLERLALPWDELFAALESAANDRVALVAIEPDTKTGTVVISGDGKDYLAALSYVSNLSRSERLERVQLVRHEKKANDPNGPVSFAVSAAWSAK